MLGIRVVVIQLLSMWISWTQCDFIIDQRFKEEHKLRPPPNPFFNTFYDKSYYLLGSQRPVYHVMFLLFGFSSFSSFANILNE